MTKPLIIAHRGASGDAPENTLISFQKALDANADGIELDVQLSADGIPMVFHDKTLKRVGNRKEHLTDLTAAELGKTDVGSWFNVKNPDKFKHEFVGQTVPTLAQVFDLMKPHNKRIYVELKCRKKDSPDLVKAVGELIGNCELVENVTVLSFNHSALIEMKSNFPHIATGALFAPKLLMLLHIRRQLIKKTQNCGADEMALHYSLAKAKTVNKGIANNLPTVIWTANNKVWVERAIRRNIAAIITNFPAKLLAELDKKVAEARTQ
jgi:glycerophosphoryl diester phosphodiesterase